VLGHLVRVWRDPLGFFHAQHGDRGVVQVRVGRRPVYLVTSPDLVRALLTDPDTFDKGGTFIAGVRALAGNGVATCPTVDHRVQRPMLQPAFEHPRIVAYSKIMWECAEELAAGWRPGQRIEVVDAMHKLAAQVVTRTLFSAEGTATAAKEIQRLFPELLAGLYRRMFIPIPLLHEVPLPANRRFDHALRTIRAIIDRTIGEYRGGVDHRPDLLSAMMATRDEETGRGLSDHEIQEQVMSLLLAAIETTGSATAWLFHSLAAHPDVERLVCAEIDEVVGERPVTMSDLRALPHLRRFLTEILRLYPPFWLLSRVTTRDVELGGYRLPAHADVVFSLYCLHRLPDAFPDPELLTPDRWLPEQVTPAQREAHMPFGVGTRKCIGDVYGLTEIPLIAVTVLQRWRLRHLPGAPITPLVAGTMRPSPLHMVVERRVGDRCVATAGKHGN
jgi:pentalenene oxygenase